MTTSTKRGVAFVRVVHPAESGVKPDLQGEARYPVFDAERYGRKFGGHFRNSSEAMRFQFAKRITPHTTKQLM